jgi:acyl-CoA thioester hydrolase
MRNVPARLDPTAYPWSIEVATRFGDMDLNAHLNNVAIANLYEEGRVRFNQHLRDRFAIGRPRFLVARVEIDYLGEARYPAPATLAVATLETGRTSWRIGLGLFQAGVCHGLCDTVMVHRGPSDSGAGPAAIPDALRAALGEFTLRA